MRVKLTYTANVEDVLGEAANLLANLRNKMDTSVKLFNGAIGTLRSDGFNGAQIHRDLDLLRRQLGELDIRLMEVIQIIDGYDQYEREQRLSALDFPDDVGDNPQEGQNGTLQPDAGETKSEEDDDY